MIAHVRAITYRKDDQSAAAPLLQGSASGNRDNKQKVKHNQRSRVTRQKTEPI